MLTIISSHYSLHISVSLLPLWPTSYSIWYQYGTATTGIRRGEIGAEVQNPEPRIQNPVISCAPATRSLHSQVLLHSVHLARTGARSISTRVIVIETISVLLQ